MKYKNPLSLLSLGFGSGLSPIAPGTVGSFFALVIYYNIFFGNLVELVDQLLFILFIVVSFFIGLYIYPKTVEEQDDITYSIRNGKALATGLKIMIKLYSIFLTSLVTN